MTKGTITQASLKSKMTCTTPNEEETLHSPPTFRPAASHRNLSFSSSSRSNSWDSSYEPSPIFSFNEEYSPTYSPKSPLIGIPFSWEQTPGIPKNHRRLNENEASSRHLLPLPPAGTTTASTKKLQNQQETISPKKDPFFAALVECSKDDDHGMNNISRGGFKINTIRSLSDRFGFINMYTSCKRTCAVSESLVYLPRPSSHPHCQSSRFSSSSSS